MRHLPVLLHRPASWLLAALCLGVTPTCVAAAAGPSPAAPHPAAAVPGPAGATVLAWVGRPPGAAGGAAGAADGPAGVITQAEFDRALALAARARFYHGKPGEAALARLQHEVVAQLVDDLLLQAEAGRRGLRADQAAITAELAAQDQRYAGSAVWQQQRAQMLPRLQRELERQSLRARLEQQVRGVPQPGTAEVEAHYASHPQQFTEPEQLRLGMILLRVDAAAPQAQWDGAIAEGHSLLRRLQGGADFAELARLHSSEASAPQGGELGYVHDGMLPAAAQEALQGRAPGDLVGPVSLLEGVAVFKLHERRPARLQPLAQVRERAAELCRRELGERAWQDLLARLRRETPHQIDLARLAPR